MIRTRTTTDDQIQQDVLAELRWDTRIEETDVGVEVDEGIVALTGTVSSYAQRIAARDAAHRVARVRDVLNEIEVRPAASKERTDADIAGAVREALDQDLLVPALSIRRTVSRGHVTLEGEVDFWAQREAAERAIQRLAGVLSIVNEITTRPQEVTPEHVQQTIESALARLAQTEAHGITVAVSGGAVLLSGRVRSFAEKRAIHDAVSHAPGVGAVRDEITIENS